VLAAFKVVGVCVVVEVVVVGIGADVLVVVAVEA
jgi:hypothetical protein